MTPDQPQPASRWYFGPDCRFCGAFIPAIADSSRGETPIRFDGAGVMKITCPSCHEEGHYAFAALQRREVPPAP